MLLPCLPFFLPLPLAACLLSFFACLPAWPPARLLAYFPCLPSQSPCSFPAYLLVFIGIPISAYRLLFAPERDMI